MHKLKVGDKGICTWGLNKGRKFVVALLLKDGFYSCRAVIDDGKYYSYDDKSLNKIN